MSWHWDLENSNFGFGLNIKIQQILVLTLRLRSFHSQSWNWNLEDCSLIVSLDIETTKTSSLSLKSWNLVSLIPGHRGRGAIISSFFQRRMITKPVLHLCMFLTASLMKIAYHADIEPWLIHYLSIEGTLFQLLFLLLLQFCTSLSIGSRDLKTILGYRIQTPNVCILSFDVG